MKKRLLFLASLASFGIALSACAGFGPVTLPSGSRVVITKMGRMSFPQSGPALTIEYETSLDGEKLRTEADEVFTYEQKLIDSSKVDSVVLMALHSSGIGFIKFAHGYNFVYQRKNDRWYALRANKTWEAVH